MCLVNEDIEFMCTVTYLPLGDDSFILTSSRDVPYKREKALQPKEYVEDGVKIVYPKDGKAGGTWIGTSEKDRLICLLNGGYKNHESKPAYRKSRGLIVKELLVVTEINQALVQIDLDEIEPFTLVIVDWCLGLELIEFVWTGKKKHIFKIPQEAHIWSSATLYDDATKKLRQEWFVSWKDAMAEFSQESILAFHKTAGNGNPIQNVLMKRDGGGTVSISSIKREKGELNFLYEAMY